MKSGKHKTHSQCKIFSDIHSCIEKEWLEFNIEIADDEGVASARKRLDGSYESAMNLVSALCFQLRYRESLKICERLYNEHSDDYALQRRLGVLYFKLLKFDESIIFLEKCLNHTNEKMQILYMIAVVRYYNGDYKESKSLLEKCAAMCKDNGEMFVAVLYWYAFCLDRLNLPPNEFIEMSKNYNFDCGHHTGYDAVVRLALKLCSEEEALKICKNDSELNACCLNYGLSVLFERHNKIKSDNHLKESLRIKDLFGAFSYIAASN